MRNEPANPWLLIAVGGVALVAALLAIVSGRQSQSTRHRWGFAVSHTIGRERNPFQFLFLTILEILIGCGLTVFGLSKLLQ